MGFFSKKSAPTPVAEHSTLAELIVADALNNGYKNTDALGVPSVLRARQLNADTPARLDVKVGDSLVPAPNALQDTQELVTEAILALQDHGVAHFRVEPNGSFRVLPYRDVTVRWNTDQTTRLYFNRDGSVPYRTTGPVPNLVVLSMNRTAGDLEGMGWMESSRIAGLVAEMKWVEEYFANNAAPTGVLEVPGTLTAQEAKRLKSQWANRSEGREPAVLSGAMSWRTTSFDAQSSQWTEGHLVGVGDVAALSGVPPSFLAYGVSGSNLTYTNLSDIWQMYWTQTLMAYVSRIEKAWTRILSEQVKFDPEPLLVASIKDRAYTASELVRTGFDPTGVVDVVGLPPIAHSGEVPVTLQQETPQNAS